MCHRKPYKKIGDCQSFGRYDGTYQLTGIRLSGLVESQTGTYIVDCCRVKGYTNSCILLMLLKSAI